MISKREIGEKGQVVIPKDIREFLGLDKGVKITFEVRGDEVILKNEQDPNKFLEEFFNVPNKEKKGSAKEIKKIILQQNDEIY
ncbi:AbrB/MazE/SpoVT family DNA-binding domain-containing protein [Candidatus Pacearchaeota archaeon]|nr:AbrB/MazE/SpoVT family DNA-binding domain-containing protein [Candidatus Pacearchaeota archaeon]